MRTFVIVGGLLFALGLAVLVGQADADGKWPGVDEAVVNKFAENAGRSPSGPFLNFGEGDIQLFLFLIAGSVGGFVAGYYYRDLFGSRTSKVKNP